MRYCTSSKMKQVMKIFIQQRSQELETKFLMGIMNLLRKRNKNFTFVFKLFIARVMEVERGFYMFTNFYHESIGHEKLINGIRLKA